MYRDLGFPARFRTPLGSSCGINRTDPSLLEPPLTLAFLKALLNLFLLFPEMPKTFLLPISLSLILLSSSALVFLAYQLPKLSKTPVISIFFHHSTLPSQVPYTAFVLKLSVRTVINGPLSFFEIADLMAVRAMGTY